MIPMGVQAKNFVWRIWSLFFGCSRLSQLQHYWPLSAFDSKNTEHALQFVGKTYKCEGEQCLR